MQSAQWTFFSVESLQYYSFSVSFAAHEMGECEKTHLVSEDECAEEDTLAGPLLEGDLEVRAEGGRGGKWT